MIVERTENLHIVQPLVFSVGPKSDVASGSAVKPITQSENAGGSQNQTSSAGQTPNPSNSNAVDLLA